MLLLATQRGHLQTDFWSVRLIGEICLDRFVSLMEDSKFLASEITDYVTPPDLFPEPKARSTATAISSYAVKLAPFTFVRPASQ